VFFSKTDHHRWRREEPSIATEAPNKGIIIVNQDMVWKLCIFDRVYTQPQVAQKMVIHVAEHLLHDMVLEFSLPF
jgi:hypothetical protein